MQNNGKKSNEFQMCLYDMGTGVKTAGIQNDSEMKANDTKTDCFLEHVSVYSNRIAKMCTTGVAWMDRRSYVAGVR